MKTLNTPEDITREFTLPRKEQVLIEYLFNIKEVEDINQDLLKVKGEGLLPRDILNRNKKIKIVSIKNEYPVSIEGEFELLLHAHFKGE